MDGVWRLGGQVVRWEASHEVVDRGSVRKAREGAGRLPDAVGHGQAVGVEQGAAHGEVGELGVKVPQVGGAALWRRNDQVQGITMHPALDGSVTQPAITLTM